jgi:hypothetical protein
LPASHPGEIADPKTLPIVRQQLNLLTDGVFLWQGEAWPGQQMEWEVQEREPAPREGAGRSWQTTLRLELPNMGSVAGIIRLDGKQLCLSLNADSKETATLMTGSLGDLEERLSASGIDVKGLAVHHEELEGA